MVSNYMGTKGLLRYFPPPHFLAPPTSGVAISDQAIRILKFKRTIRGLIPIMYGERLLQPGIIKDGDVAKPLELKEVLVEARHHFGLEHVSISIPDDKAYVFRADVPDISDTLIRNNLELRLEEFIPLSASDAVFDFAKLENSTEKAGFMTVGVTAISTGIVEHFSDVLWSAGLFPRSFKIESQAINQAIIPPGDPRTFLILNFGNSITNVAVVKNSVVLFTSTVAIGGDAFTTAIRKYFSVDLEEAEQIKEDGSFFKNKDNLDLFTSIVNTLSVLRDEINRVLVYWHEYQARVNESSGGKIDTILLCGRDAAVNGFREYLSSTMEINVEISNVWMNAFSFDAYVPQMTFRESLNYAAPIGLALSHPE